MQVLRTLVLATIATTAIAGRVAAQSTPTPTPRSGDRDAARQYVDAGIKAQEAGDYRMAFAYYEKAYQIVPHPLLIFDMAQASRLAGDTDKALALYERYLVEDPDGAKAADARALVADLQARAAEGSSDVGDMQRTDKPRTAGAQRATRLAPPVRVAEEETPPGRDPSDAAAPSSGRNLRWAGIATIAVGAASLAIGAGFAVRAHTLAEDVSRMYYPDMARAGRRADVIAVTGLGAGAVLVAVGGALCWWAHHRAEPATSITLAPMVSGRGAGLVVSGTL